MDLIKKNLKWIGTVLVFTGILLMYLNIYPLNIFFMDQELLHGQFMAIFIKIKLS